MEGYLKEKERAIQALEFKIKEKIQKPSQQPPKGDLIDEMIGQYIN